MALAFDASPLVFVSVDSKGFSISVSRLESICTTVSVSVAYKGVSALNDDGQDEHPKMKKRPNRAGALGRLRILPKNDYTPNETSCQGNSATLHSYFQK